MKEKGLRLYNVIFPIWVLMFWPTPPVILLTLLGNLVIDGLVVFLTLLAMKHPAKGNVLRGCWWKVWLLGFLSDLIGALWLALGMLGAWALEAGGAGWVSGFAMAMTLDPFRHPLALLWTAIGAASAGPCSYLFDRRVFRRVPELDQRQGRILALTMAVVTAPWLFFIPMYA